MELWRCVANAKDFTEVNGDDPFCARDVGVRHRALRKRGGRVYVRTRDGGIGARRSFRGEVRLRFLQFGGPQSIVILERMGADVVSR